MSLSIRDLVDRAFVLRSEIKVREAELANITEMLKKRALKAPQEELVDDEREGRRYLARGSASIVPVVFTADMIMGSFSVGSPKHEAVETAASGRFEEFFRKVHKCENRFEDGQQFRRHAQELLGKDSARFITACLARDKNGIPKSDIKIQWDRAQALEAAG